MDISDKCKEMGRTGEAKARLALKNNGFTIAQIDWLGLYKMDSKYYTFEIKNKDMFKAPPFDGHGLDVRQVEFRLKFQKDTGIRCIFMVLDEKQNCWYWNFLDVLEAASDNQKITTKNGVRIYELSLFKKSRGPTTLCV